MVEEDTRHCSVTSFLLLRVSARSAFRPDLAFFLPHKNEGLRAVVCHSFLRSNLALSGPNPITAGAVET